MFSEEGATQEMIALALAVVAFVYVVLKVTGIRLFKRNRPTSNVVVGGRLQKGLDRASGRGSDRVG